MATAHAEQSANPVAVIRQNLQLMEPEFKAALPPHIPVEKFARVAMTAVQNTPDLQAADRRSLFGAIVRLAQDGLLPDGREAALVIFNVKKGNGWEKRVQAMPMIGGILKRIRQSGEVAKVSAQVVHENDRFVVKYGFDEDIEHSPPPLDQPRGKPIGAYATAVLKDGSRLLEVMSLEEIEKVRAVSKAKDNGPWVAWWGEMARKTVMRRLSKRLPMSTDLEEQIFSRDETLTAKERVLHAVEQPEPQVSRLEALEHHLGETVDAVTGEVSEPAVEPPEITEQAEEVEAKITTLGDQLGLDAEPPADALIAQIKAAKAKLDVNALVSAVDFEGWSAADVERVNDAAEERKREIDAARKGAVEGVE